MPWIDPQFLECTVYLYPSEADADDGNRIGGSGFLAGIPLTERRSPNLVFVVTNKHVIDAGGMVVRINTVDGGRDIIPLDGARWYRHLDGDDLAVCPIRLTTSHKWKFVSTRHFLTKKQIEDYEIGPGDEVFVVGRFVNHEGKQRNTPSVRFGSISQMPYEPIIVNGYPQESFLVEARSISGYSGSPVFVYLPPSMLAHFPHDLQKDVREGKFPWPGESKKRVGMPAPMGPWLMGVDYCHIRWDEPVWSRTSRRPVNDDWFVKSNTGMMGVIPAWKLNDVIEGAEMKPVIDAARQEADAILKKNDGVELDVARFADAPASDENPTHREDFNSLLGKAARKPPQDD